MLPSFPSDGRLLLSPGDQFLVSSGDQFRLSPARRRSPIGASLVMNGTSRPIDNATAAAVTGLVALGFLAYGMDYYAFVAREHTAPWQTWLAALPRIFYALSGARIVSDGLAVALVAGTSSFAAVKIYRALRARIMLPNLARRMVSEERILEQAKRAERERLERPAGVAGGKKPSLALVAIGGGLVGLVLAWLLAR